MANAISVKGIGKIIDQVAGEIMEAAKKAHALDPATRFEATGTVRIEGKYGFGKDGEFGLVGNLVATVGGAPIPVHVEGSGGEAWNSDGDGTLDVEFFIKVTLG